MSVMNMPETNRIKILCKKQKVLATKQNPQTKTEDDKNVPHGNVTTDTGDDQNRKLSGWAQQQNGGDRKRVS